MSQNGFSDSFYQGFEQLCLLTFWFWRHRRSLVIILCFSWRTSVSFTRKRETRSTWERGNSLPSVHGCCLTASLDQPNVKDCEERPSFLMSWRENYFLVKDDWELAAAMLLLCVCMCWLRGGAFLVVFLLALSVWVGGAIKRVLLCEWHVCYNKSWLIVCVCVCVLVVVNNDEQQQKHTSELSLFWTRLWEALCEKLSGFLVIWQQVESEANWSKCVLTSRWETLPLARFW